MSVIYTEGATFEKQDYVVKPLIKGDYENCDFLYCDFSSSFLTGVNFINCNFKHCNLSLAKLNQASFRNVSFDNCKLLGLHFEYCNDFLFEVYFENCLLNLSSFYKLKMKKTKFIQCEMQEVDFSNTDLSLSVFDTCNLMGSTFDNTNLEKADLRGAQYFSIDPELNKIKKAKVNTASLAGFLHKYDLEIEL
jgi:uncharacterized protein YjbI with pentapeptide repeats